MATTASAWAKPGAWALDSEEHDAMETLQQQEKEADPSESSDFPSLAAAAAAKSSKKKKKAQTLSLAEFNTGKPVTYGSAKFQVRAASSDAPGPKGLTPDELLILPTGPRERTAEELERASSRGFNYSSYGGGGGRPRMNGAGDDSGSRWGSSRVSDEPRRSSLDLGPSRADEIDDWGAAKRSAAPPVERRERTGGFSESQSRADGLDSWISNKSTAPPSSVGHRIGDGYRERRGGFEMFNKEVSNGGVGVDSDTWGKKREEASGGRPRLKLQPRSLPLADGNGEHHGEQQQQGSTVRIKGLNPFGAARPREEVLAEKGKDWKKIDGQLESMKIQELGSALGEGHSFGKKGFQLGNDVQEDRTERNWRKTDFPDAPSPPTSAENVEDGADDN